MINLSKILTLKNGLIALNLILFIVVANIWLKSFKKDHTIDRMRQELKLKEQERQDIIHDRSLLQASLDSNRQNIRALNTSDSLLQVSIGQFNKRIDKINSVTNERIKAIDHYSSDQLQQYFRELPNDY